MLSGLYPSCVPHRQWLWHFLCSATWPKNTCKQDFGDTASNPSSKFPFPCFVGHKRSFFFFQGYCSQEARRKVCRNVYMQKREKKTQQNKVQADANKLYLVQYSLLLTAAFSGEENILLGPRTPCTGMGFPQGWCTAPRKRFTGHKWNTGSDGGCSLLVAPFNVHVVSHKSKAKSCTKWSCNFISKSVIEHLGHQPQNVRLICLKKKSSYFKNEKLKSKSSP